MSSPQRKTLPENGTGRLREEIESLWQAVGAITLQDSADIGLTRTPRGLLARLKRPAPQNSSAPESTFIPRLG